MVSLHRSPDESKTFQHPYILEAGFLSVGFNQRVGAEAERELPTVQRLHRFGWATPPGESWDKPIPPLVPGLRFLGEDRLSG